MSKKQVLKNIPCSSPRIQEDILMNKKISHTYILCKNNNGYIQVILDHNYYVISIEKSIKFNVEPDFNKIENKIFRKYGKASKIAKEKTTSKGSGERIVYCWGDNCKTLRKNTNYWYGTEMDSPNDITSLIIKYENYYFDSKVNSLNFFIRDSNKEAENFSWEQKEKKLYKEQQKQKASDIDF